MATKKLQLGNIVYLNETGDIIASPNDGQNIPLGVIIGFDEEKARVTIQSHGTFQYDYAYIPDNYVYKKPEIFSET